MSYLLKMHQFDQLGVVNMQIAPFFGKDTTLKRLLYMSATTSHESTSGGRRQCNSWGFFNTPSTKLINFAFGASPEAACSWAISASSFLFLRHWQETNIVMPYGLGWT